jgi:chloramphenicol 3-O phosphotransferase
MEHSRIVVLNGAPSSGKTTISSAFRDERASLGDFWLVTGIDDYLAKLPTEWRSADGRGGPYAADGVRFEAVEGEMRVNVGSVGRLLLRAYQASVAAASRAGLNVMVDEVVVDRTSWQDWGVALAGLDVVWVGIRCSADVAEERNRARGDERYAGLATVLTVAVHQDAIYDFEIDTTALSTDASGCTRGTHPSPRVPNDVVLTTASLIDPLELAISERPEGCPVRRKGETLRHNWDSGVEDYGSPEYVVGVGVGRPPALLILWKFSAVIQASVQSACDATPGGTVLQSYPDEAIARSQPC